MNIKRAPFKIFFYILSCLIMYTAIFILTVYNNDKSNQVNKKHNNDKSNQVNKKHKYNNMTELGKKVLTKIEKVPLEHINIIGKKNYGFTISIGKEPNENFIIQVSKRLKKGYFSFKYYPKNKYISEDLSNYFNVNDLTAFYNFIIEVKPKFDKIENLRKNKSKERIKNIFNLDSLEEVK